MKYIISLEFILSKRNSCYQIFRDFPNLIKIGPSLHQPIIFLVK